jgi:CLIP-associating protein 1/2
MPNTAEDDDETNDLCRSAPDHAKADLKKQMIAREVRKTIMSFIVQHLDMRSTGEADLTASSLSTATTVQDLGQSTHVMGESVMSEQPPPQESAAIDPLYVHTQRELEDMFREMPPPFEGKETEHNWLARDKTIRKLRRLLQGNAPSDFHTVFVAGIISMRDSIIKVTNTLRTTMSTNACQLVQELYRALGTAMDPTTEIFAQNFIKMGAATKQIASKNADASMEAILSNSTLNQRLLHHIWLTFGEKNAQSRSLAPGWLKVVMKKSASHKAHVEHIGGIEFFEKCLRKGLDDASPKVKESTRAAYWTYAQIWHDQAERQVIDSHQAVN